jgi:hypothetical protein
MAGRRTLESGRLKGFIELTGNSSDLNDRKEESRDLASNTGNQISDSGVREDDVRDQTLGSDNQMQESEVRDSETRDQTPDSEDQSRRIRRKRPTSRYQTPTSNHMTSASARQIVAREIDAAIMDQAVAMAEASPKVSIYSPLVAAVLNCKALTVVKYRPSTEIREILEKALSEAYPELCEEVTKRLIK